MGRNTGIEWTDATFNPWWGCTKVSPGCDNCYAEGVAMRFHPDTWGANGARRVFESKHWREPLGWNRKAELAGVPMRVFSGSMCDVFEKHSVAEEYRPELFSLIHKTPWLRWQLLTKRVGNVARMVPTSWMKGHWPSNAWIGATIVNQEEADRDIVKLLALPAPVLFLSCEPLLGPLDLTVCMYTTTGQPGDGNRWLVLNALTGFRATSICGGVTERRIDWVIAGGESGRNARKMDPSWPRSIQAQCAKAGVPFFFKQWGEYDSSGNNVGKVIAGKLLDGVAYREFPRAAN